MDPDPEPLQTFLQLGFSEHISSSDIVLNLVIGLAVLVVFIILSGLFSSSESAFFSLSPNDIEELKSDSSKQASRAITLLEKPDLKTGSQRLLALILVLNNLVNVFIIIYASYIVDTYFEIPPFTKFILQVVVITFLLVLFGEIIPKIFATRNNIRVVKLMAHPLQISYKFFSPIVRILAGSSQLFDKYWSQNNEQLTVEEINQAIDLTHNGEESTEKNLLKGIINFGNTNARQIMTPRTEIFAAEIEFTFEELLSLVEESGFSRIPIFKENVDNIQGVLYIKDIIPYLNQSKNYTWQKLIRPTIFVPQTKKIDDLLTEFQEKRIHLAVVVDEYGGTKGLVTMEDILEEVFGEIKDEFDDENADFKKINDKIFFLNGILSLTDLTKILNLETTIFDAIKNDAETVGGLLIELKKGIPEKGEELIFENFTFTVLLADKRRVKRVKLKIDEL